MPSAVFFPLADHTELKVFLMKFAIFPNRNLKCFQTSKFYESFVQSSVHLERVNSASRFSRFVVLHIWFDFCGNTVVVHLSDDNF